MVFNKVFCITKKYGRQNNYALVQEAPILKRTFFEGSFYSQKRGFLYFESDAKFLIYFNYYKIHLLRLTLFEIVKFPATMQCFKRIPGCRSTHPSYIVKFSIKHVQIISEKKLQKKKHDFWGYVRQKTPWNMKIYKTAHVLLTNKTLYHLSQLL